MARPPSGSGLWPAARGALGAAALLAGLLPAAAFAAEATLWLVEPERGGNLAHCPERAERAVAPAPATARPLGIRAQLRWAGGRFTLANVMTTGGDAEPVTDRCFALVVDGRVVASGAVLATISARLVRFPVLQVPVRQVFRRAPDEPLDLFLGPEFPADASSPTPPGWQGALSGLK